MNTRKTLSIVALLVLLAAALPVGTVAAPTGQDPRCEITPLVMDGLPAPGPPTPTRTGLAAGLFGHSAPVLVPAGLPATAAITPDPHIQLMLDQVTSAQVSEYDRQMAGDLPVWVDGGWYTIPSRYTYSGTPIQKTTFWIGQHFQNDLGLDVEYHVWGDSTHPNVIAEIPGQVSPDDIWIIGGHVDDVQGTPGADDNGSGSVATMIAADIMSQYNWSCTLRFAVWTGEEQGLLGSDAYAFSAWQNDENIVGYINLDTIAWNTFGSSPGIDLLYDSTMPPSQQLAQLFADTVDAYNLDLVPEILPDYMGESDHASFWEYSYNAILATEDEDDHNPWYHTSQDTPAHTNLAYFTEFVKASLGTLAHASGCLIPSGIGSMDGYVIAAQGGAPIAGATVSVADQAGHVFSASTDSIGYYTRTLLADTYLVTATAYGYLPASVGGVVVVTDTVTHQDFGLQPMLPAIVVSPAALSATLTTGQRYTSTLTIGNEGTAPLAFTITEQSALDWLAESPISGTVAPSTSNGVSVAFDSTGLPVGSYSGTLAVASNDPLLPSVAVPVTLTVLAACKPVSATDFVWAPLTLSVGQASTFTATARGTAPITFAWDFGDGSGAAGPLATHTYGATGDYTVTLTATNCGIYTAVATHRLIIAARCAVYLPLVVR